jgi:signal transduction histidine kinase
VLRLLKDTKSNETIPDDEHPTAKVLKSREPTSQTFQLLTRTGKKLFISLVVSPVVIPKSNELFGAVAVFRDVSQEKSQEQQRADFISTASHEMRTPVAAIEGYLALALNDKVSKIDSHAREYLEKAHTSTQHLGQLFQDLLTSAKAEDGRLTSHPVVVEISQFVEQLADDLRFGAQKKGLEMEFVINNHPGTAIIDASGTTTKALQPLYYAHVDPDRLREVITNVFDNAVKYTETGKISVGITGNNEVVQIRITDTGPGIPAEDVPHLFQKFYRVDNSATRSVGGTGLGLFICRKIIELYNGTIWAESTVGQGSTFYINLPRLDSARATQMQQSEQSASPLAL